MGLPFQDYGVTPASFSGLEVGFTFDVALPLWQRAGAYGDKSWTNDATTWWLAAIGRLKPGWRVEQATAQPERSGAGDFHSDIACEYDAAAREIFELYISGFAGCDGSFRS